jgi:hypothetical protein
VELDKNGFLTPVLIQEACGSYYTKLSISDMDIARKGIYEFHDFE